jgi:hypothetical protein
MTTPDGSGIEPGPEPRPEPGPAGDRDVRRRPLVERLGLAAIALVLASLFLVIGAAAFVGGELFLAAMGVIGCLMVLWVGGVTLFRG